ncbi:gluconate 2-dehydrogenase subunit 3 family protein [Acidimangrovimonas sediminis]|uniref:gluconate 2-dehydrogenase subunit 3 family protein n=1 Tax=Acidimangrovimonas sediminis TaxID=2056283 RepID=UPI000C7FFA3D|nr:gluconate 2-dehydrogenase subunit 3 family protein [Acidimangrovimonas sediminis]
MTGPFRTPYPGYDVLDKWDSPSYDDATREVLRARTTPPPRRFLSEARFAVLAALCDTVIPQPRARPVQIAPFLNAALHDDRGTGTRFAVMPPDRDAWPLGLDAIDAEAKAHHDGTGFADLARPERTLVLKEIDAERLRAPDAWQDMPAQKFFRALVLKQIAQFYYSQPAAMSEIGYGGPASPRGYVRLNAQGIDPWEAPYGQWKETDA